MALTPDQRTAIERELAAIEAALAHRVVFVRVIVDERGDELYRIRSGSAVLEP